MLRARAVGNAVYIESHSSPNGWGYGNVSRWIEPSRERARGLVNLINRLLAMQNGTLAVPGELRRDHDSSNG